MSEFVDWHIDLGRKEWLVKALLDLIKNDSEIKETDIFYIRKNGCPVAKQDIRKMEKFDLQPFLTGVLHFILMHRMNKTPMVQVLLLHSAPSVHTRSASIMEKLVTESPDLLLLKTVSFQILQPILQSRMLLLPKT